MKIIECLGDSRNGWPRATEEIPNIHETNFIGLKNEWWREFKYYSEEGHVYGIKPSKSLPKISILHKLMSLVYAPSIRLEVESYRIGKYNFKELKELLISWIENDSDCFSNFIESKDFSAEIENSTNFVELFGKVSELNDRENGKL